MLFSQRKLVCGFLAASALELLLVTAPPLWTKTSYSQPLVEVLVAVAAMEGAKSLLGTGVVAVGAGGGGAQPGERALSPVRGPPQKKRLWSRTGRMMSVQHHNAMQSVLQSVLQSVFTNSAMGSASNLAQQPDSLAPQPPPPHVPPTT